MTNGIEGRRQITEAIKSFNQKLCAKSSVELLNTLGYQSNKTLKLENTSPDLFLDTFNEERILDIEKSIVEDWESIEILFQITDADVRDVLGQQSLFSAMPYENTNINSFLYLSLCLSGNSYTRTQLARITREINKMFMMPVIILFTYNKKISIGIIMRRLHKRDASKDVLEKVTLIKDIDFKRPHRAHIEILFDLSIHELRKQFPLNNFANLQKAWQSTLDIEELNKKFYKEIADWYFWAVKNVTFPKGENSITEENRNAINVIRLITRLIFVWFLKEKHLVPDELFNENKLQEYLKFEEFEGESVYYKAILQNLFFATLNQEMNVPGKDKNRKFRSTNSNPHGRDGNWLITNLYRYERFFKQPQEALKFFEGIPFLNGGLFECLDKKIEKDGKEIVIRIDGFSDHNKNPLKVPNKLFFGDEIQVDLNDIYNTIGKRYKVQGLIRILNSYKFTVEENTPIEEEVALDPELLGKVFENLLAAYNPETSTTARKVTGSYYTPRTIVEYMVDEALIAYLQNYLVEGFQSSVTSNNTFESRLRELFSYTESPHQFDEQETRLLIEAIDELDVLDPACGSGAFPMGILHKLVYVLGRLDPENVIWQDIQLEKAVKETKEAYKIGDEFEQRQRVLDIEETFDNNTSDYGRKLYLIESCLYGVDIQPIAVQIAKLRFFISLIVDQSVNSLRPNLGIRPLPNLETKFVAANTLISLDKPLQPTLQETSIINKLETKQEELAHIRHKLFLARTQETKRKYRKFDKEKRLEIKELLVQSGWKNESATLLANWDPYDQNTSSPFFESKWMMGIKEGFDIVLANPPYINVENISQIIKDNISNFRTAYMKYDIYVLFYEKGLDLLKPKGTLCYITSNKFLSQGYGYRLRQEFLKYKIKHIINFNYDIFESATVRTCIMHVIKKYEEGNISKVIDVNKKNDFDKFVNRKYSEVNQSIFSKIDKSNFRLNITNTKLDIFRKIEAECLRVDQICSVNYGLRPSSETKGLGKDAFIFNNNKTGAFKKYFEGKDMGYWLVKNHYFLNYRPDIMYNAMFPELFENEKLAGLRTLSDIWKLRFIYDNSGYYCNDSVVLLTLWKNFVGVNHVTIKRKIKKQEVNPKS